VILTVLFCLFTLMMSTVIQDFEFRRNFSQRNQTSNPKANGWSSFTSVEDVSFALCRMDGLIDQLHANIEDYGFSATDENEDGSSKPSSLFASLSESRHLCQAVYAALLGEFPTGRDLVIKRNAQYSFHKICTRIFATFESNSDCALPLFIDETATEIFISDPRGMFELVLFLLIYEAVKGEGEG
jgi:hypothetical protein